MTTPTPAESQPIRCDKCPAQESAAATIYTCTCPDCGRAYHRCQEHGGILGALRSLHSHRGLYHAQEQDDG